MIKVNDKEVSIEEALEYINDDTKKITEFSVDLINDKPRGKLNNEGLEIPKEIIQGMSEQMDEVGASMCQIVMSESANINGKTVRIVMHDADFEGTIEINPEE